MSLAWANKQTDYFGNLTFFQRNKNVIFFAASFVIGIIFAYVGTFIFKGSFNYLFEIPHNKGISTADFWNKGVDWIFDTFFVYIKAFNTWLIPVSYTHLTLPTSV